MSDLSAYLGVSGLTDVGCQIFNAGVAITERFDATEGNPSHYGVTDVDLTDIPDTAKAWWDSLSDTEAVAEEELYTKITLEFLKNKLNIGVPEDPVVVIPVGPPIHPIAALSLRYALDQTQRTALSPVGAVTSSNIYLGNLVNIQACLFIGTPSVSTFVSDLSNLLKTSLVIHAVNALGEMLVQKDIDPLTATLNEWNPYCTYEEWTAGTASHFQFSLGVLDTNVSVPSCGRLEYYAGVAVSTATGPILMGFFKGYLIDDGVAVWIIGVTATGAPVLFFRLIDAYVESATSLESIQGNVLSNNSIVKCVIDSSNSEWLVVKPATRSTDVAAGVIRLLDGMAHLERIEGL